MKKFALSLSVALALASFGSIAATATQSQPSDQQSSYKVEIFSSQKDKADKLVSTEVFNLQNDQPTPFLISEETPYIASVSHTGKKTDIVRGKIYSGVNAILVANTKDNSIHYKVKITNLNSLKDFTYQGDTIQQPDVSSFAVDDTQTLHIGQTAVSKFAEQGIFVNNFGGNPQHYTLKVTRLN